MSTEANTFCCSIIRENTAPKNMYPSTFFTFFSPANCAKITRFIFPFLILFSVLFAGAGNADNPKGTNQPGAGSVTIAPAAAQGTILLGSAIFSDKSSHAGITVTLSGNGVKQTAKTDAGGTYSFSGIPPAAGYQLKASFGTDYLAARGLDVAIKPDGLSRADTLVLQAKPGTVSGVVALEDDDSRVGFTFEDLASGASLMQTDPALNGAFTFRGVPAGKRIIRLFKPGFESRLLLVEVPANGTVTLDPVELSSHVGSLEATFTLDGASVHNDIWVVLEGDVKSFYYSGKTDAAGRVRIEGIRAGAYRLLAMKTVSEDLVIDPVVITEGAVTTLPNETHTATTLTMLKGSISGVVRLNTISDYNGGDIVYEQTPCYGCFVVTPGAMTISDKDGRFLLTGLPEGDYSVHVSYETCITGLHDAFSSPSFSITAASPAHNFRSPLPMYESRGTLSGVARLEGQTTVHSNIVVTVEGLTGYFTTTDAQGNYTLPSVPARNKRFTLVFTRPNYTPASLTNVTVSKDTVTTLKNVKLAPLPSSLGGS